MRSILPSSSFYFYQLMRLFLPEQIHILSRFCIALPWLYSVACLSGFSLWFKATIISSFMQSPLVSIVTISVYTRFHLHFSAVRRHPNFIFFILFTVLWFNYIKWKRKRLSQLSFCLSAFFIFENSQEFLLRLITNNPAKTKICYENLFVILIGSNDV